MEAMQAIEETTTLFYQQKNQEGYQLLNHTLTVLIQVVNEIFTIKQENNTIDIDEQKLNLVLGDAMVAIEQKDTILLSDLLNFDLRIILEKLSKQLS